MKTKYISIFIISFLMMSCLTDDDLNIPYSGNEPQDIGDGHVLSDPETEGIDSELLNEIYQDVYEDENLWSMRSLLVFRNGKLVSEAYLKDENDITQRHLIWSCTKQVIGVLSGIAYSQGIIKSLDDPISNYLVEAQNYPDKADITLRNLLTMQSGIAYSNDGAGGETDQMLRQLPDNSIDFILGLPKDAEQGIEFHYNDGNPHLMSAIIQRSVGKPTDEWADDVLFSKIEMTNYNWIRYRDGITMGGYGIETTPRELAKIALCIADSGRWKGLQVVDPSWIKEMTSPLVYTDYDNNHMGYYWWVDTQNKVYSMDGHGGQYAFVVPDKKLVVVMTAFPNTQDDYQIRPDEAMPVVKKIIAAIKD